MCLPMTATQKQLVEDYLDLVPRMVNAMTHPHTGTTAEEKEELCQIGYLALCRAASMCRPGSVSSLMQWRPSAMPSIVIGRGLPATGSSCARWKAAALPGRMLPLPLCFPISPMMRCIRNRRPVRRQSQNTLPPLKADSAAPSRKGWIPFFFGSKAIPAKNYQICTTPRPIISGHGRAKPANYYGRMRRSVRF